ncbi:52K [Red-eared slider adenovirus 1]|uniref:52K n=1 Tax=Red-eared slider adenovirus 1 TaxID=2749458 RepID=UPI002481C5D6|nr:52K [Red-eared slider adenovirus 1]QLD29000.1 52K [Red-eared slider adenovirus 1]
MIGLLRNLQQTPASAGSAGGGGSGPAPAPTTLGGGALLDQHRGASAVAAAGASTLSYDPPPNHPSRQDASVAEAAAAAALEQEERLREEAAQTVQEARQEASRTTGMVGPRRALLREQREAADRATESRLPVQSLKYDERTNPALKDQWLLSGLKSRMDPRRVLVPQDFEPLGTQDFSPAANRVRFARHKRKTQQTLALERAKVRQNNEELETLLEMPTVRMGVVFLAAILQRLLQDPTDEEALSQLKFVLEHCERNSVLAAILGNSQLLSPRMKWFRCIVKVMRLIVFEDNMTSREAVSALNTMVLELTDSYAGIVTEQLTGLTSPSWFHLNSTKDFFMEVTKAILQCSAILGHYNTTPPAPRTVPYEYTPGVSTNRFMSGVGEALTEEGYLPSASKPLWDQSGTGAVRDVLFAEDGADGGGEEDFFDEEEEENELGPCREPPDWELQ